MSEEQSAEIAEALGVDKDAFVASPTEIIPPIKEDEWGRWEDSVEERLTQLVNDSKLLKLSVGAVACVGLAAIAASAMVAKSMAGIMGAMNQLGLNQQAIAEAIGMVPTDGPNFIKTPTKEEVEASVAKPDIADAKTFDVPADTEVAEPYDGPASEASAAAVAQMEQDKKNGIIDAAKEGDGVE
jgi:hypothetical protein